MLGTSGHDVVQSPNFKIKQLSVASDEDRCRESKNRYNLNLATNMFISNPDCATLQDIATKMKEVSDVHAINGFDQTFSQVVNFLFFGNESTSPNSNAFHNMYGECLYFMTIVLGKRFQPYCEQLKNNGMTQYLCTIASHRQFRNLRLFMLCFNYYIQQYQEEAIVIIQNLTVDDIVCLLASCQGQNDTIVAISGEILTSLSCACQELCPDLFEPIVNIALPLCSLLRAHCLKCLNPLFTTTLPPQPFLDLAVGLLETSTVPFEISTALLFATKFQLPPVERILDFVVSTESPVQIGATWYIERIAKHAPALLAPIPHASLIEALFVALDGGPASAKINAGYALMLILDAMPLSVRLEVFDAHQGSFVNIIENVDEDGLVNNVLRFLLPILDKRPDLVDVLSSPTVLSNIESRQSDAAERLLDILMM